MDLLGRATACSPVAAVSMVVPPQNRISSRTSPSIRRMQRRRRGLSASAGISEFGVSELFRRNDGRGFNLWTLASSPGRATTKMTGRRCPASVVKQPVGQRVARRHRKYQERPWDYSRTANRDVEVAAGHPNHEADCQTNDESHSMPPNFKFASGSRKTLPGA